MLDRAFAILNAFGPGDNRLSLAELSRRTNLYKSTLLRLLGALEHGGFIRRLDDGQDAIGPSDNDLTRQHDGEPLGERIFVSGRVLDENSRPVRGALPVGAAIHAARPFGSRPQIRQFACRRTGFASAGDR